MGNNHKYFTTEERIAACKRDKIKYSKKDYTCDICSCTIHLGNKWKHLKSKKHLQNASATTE